MRTRIDLFIYSLVVILSIIFIYASGCFANAELDLSKWNKENRTILSTVWLLFNTIWLIFYLSALVEEYSKNSKNNKS